MLFRFGKPEWKCFLVLLGLLVGAVAAGCGQAPAPEAPEQADTAVAPPAFPPPAPFTVPENWTFRIELRRPSQPEPIFIQFMPLVFDVQAGDRLTVVFRTPPGKDVALALSFLLNNAQKPERPAPEDWRARADRRELTPTVEEVAPSEDKFWRLTWPLPAGAKEFALTFPRADRLLLTMQNVPWDWRQTGCPESPFCFDYFFGGGYLTTIPAAFERCTRSGDFFVLHQTKGKFVDPVLALRITQYNSRLPQPDQEHYFTATVDGRELIPTLRQLTAAEGGELEFTWQLRPEWEIVRLDQHVEVRFQAALVEKAPDWPAIDDLIHHPTAGKPLPPNVTRRLETNPNQPCFP